MWNSREKTKAMGKQRKRMAKGRKETARASKRLWRKERQREGGVEEGKLAIGDGEPLNQRKLYARRREKNEAMAEG